MKSGNMNMVATHSVKDEDDKSIGFMVNGQFISNETIKAGIDGLSSIRDEIKEYLLSKDAMVQYIKENGLEILTISFYNGVLEDSYLRSL